MGIRQEETEAERLHTWWIGYYHLADMKRFLLDTDEWLRRRIRMCIWKAWKKPKTKVANLIKCGIENIRHVNGETLAKVIGVSLTVYIESGDK